ncbi:hypothetical protein C8J57DRAFT_1463262 [Mycena rebaudengoi]|nr:hypothetical protein C8J57DRAFT_1463262 [Mycena rebaudengoi]
MHAAAAARTSASDIYSVPYREYYLCTWGPSATNILFFFFFYLVVAPHFHPPTAWQAANDSRTAQRTRTHAGAGRQPGPGPHCQRRRPRATSTILNNHQFEKESSVAREFNVATPDPGDNRSLLGRACVDRIFFKVHTRGWICADDYERVGGVVSVIEWSYCWSWEGGRYDVSTATHTWTDDFRADSEPRTGGARAQEDDVVKNPDRQRPGKRGEGVSEPARGRDDSLVVGKRAASRISAPIASHGWAEHARRRTTS